MIVVAEEVRAALDGNRPVVALESTLVAHGLPWPENLEVARALEAAVRGEGAVPATVAVLGGRVTVGVGPADLERIARGGFRKLGRADLAVAVSQRLDGATTVSATVFTAARAGIALLATGGIGGVHRGTNGDVSSDLTTLAEVPIAVVSAGAKAVLDLARTLELLETLGVLVVGYRTSEWPAFYVRRSGLQLEHRVDDARAAAELIDARFALGEAGVLVANPIPEAAALDERTVSQAVSDAVLLAEQRGITGKALTPLLLAEVAKATHGRSLQANRALILENGRVAAAIASALEQIRSRRRAGS